MKLHKLLVLLSVTAILCALFPIGHISATSASNLMQNGDFETGSGTGWDVRSGSSITSSVVHNGSYALTTTNTTSQYQTMASQSVAVTANTEYTITFWYYYNGSNASPKFYLYILDSAKANVSGKSYQPAATSTWYQATLTFNSGDNTTILVYLKNDTKNDGGTYYYDDFILTGPESEPEEPEAVNNLVVNGDIETGDTTGWSSYSTTTVSSTVAHGGMYSLKSTNTSGQYNTMTKQTITVEANTDYTYSFWYYYDGSNASPSFYAQVNSGDGSTTLVSLSVKNVTALTWTYVSVNFNSGDNTSVILYTKNRTASDGGVYYFDDFMVPAPATEEPEEPEEPEVPEQPEGDNLIPNPGFETGTTSGWTVYNGTTVTAGAKYEGNYGLQCKGLNWNSIANTLVDVENGKSYRLSFWYKINVAGFNWKISGNVTGTEYAGTWINTDLGVWKQVVVEFVADDTKVKLNLSGLNADSTPDFYVDNVMLYEVPGPSNDGFIINGDFEIGTTVGWNLHQQTALSAAAAHNSNYGINLKGNGGWGGMLNQTFTTKKGLKYTLTLDLKVNTYGTNVQVRNVADDTVLAGGWLTKTEWTTYTYTFTAISTSTYLNFCGGGKGAEQGLTEDVYVDNIKIVEIPCVHEYDGLQDDDCNVCGETRDVPLVDIVESGQTSVSEDVTGLAFRFEIAATGTRMDNNNRYVSGSAAIKPFGNDDYTLIAMGAIITNKAAFGTEDVLNLNTVNGKTVVKNQCVYLAEASDTSLVFTARIINIPESGKNTTVYARPYYVFEKDGATVVVYDQIVSQTYTAAIG
ncbi:MAG: carbohydrate binding domain-containing protein, partial [Clostridia bacterium]|nr:carbohydrate binding domain-containing protein [Clostridia bacterium]